MIKNKTILITGVAGSIGSELCCQVAKNNKVIALDNNETELYRLYQQIDTIPVLADIRDKPKLEKTFAQYRPDIVYHAAAYKHITFAYADREEEEDYPFGYQQSDELIKTNIYGLQNIIDCCQKYKSKLVFISSDKAVNPNSMMGLTKRIGEMLCQENGFTSVRFGNVLVSRGSVIPLWKKQIKEKKPITLTDRRMKRYFMSVEKACQLVIKASKLGKGIFIFDMGKPIKVIDLAKKVAGKDYPIKFIGIRKGEKLVEELVSKEEKTISTSIKKIYKIVNKNEI